MKYCEKCGEIEEHNHKCLLEDLAKKSLEREEQGDFGSPFTYETLGDPEDVEYVLLDRNELGVMMSGCSDNFMRHLIERLNDTHIS